MERENKRLDRTELERQHSRRKNANPGNRSEDPEPHHALSNPASDPDETEFPDPYDRREDPRGPGEDDEGGERHTDAGAVSTSEPHPEDFDDVKPVKGDEDFR
jgi:hypothetical protein